MKKRICIPNQRRYLPQKHRPATPKPQVREERVRVGDLPNVDMQWAARRIKSDEWSCTFYSHFEGEHHNCMGILFKHCIPYEGNEHLVGTTDEPKEGGAE